MLNIRPSYSLPPEILPRNRRSGPPKTASFPAKTVLCALLFWLLLCSGVLGAAAGDSLRPESRDSAGISDIAARADSLSQSRAASPDAAGYGSEVESSIMRLVKVISAFLIVIGLLLLFLYLVKRFLYRPRGLLVGQGQIELLQTFSLGPRRHLSLVKVGKRIVLIGVTETAISALMEISDPEEVERILSQIDQAGKTQPGQFQDLYQGLIGKFKK